MKYLKLYEQLQSENEIIKILTTYGIINYTINNGFVDVDGDVNLYKEKLTKIPVKFGEVNGDFDCSFNLLTSLENSPKRVIGDFYCHGNKLTSLEFCPEYIDGSLLLGHGNVIGNNKIYDFVGIGRVTGNIVCQDTPIQNIWNLFQDETKLELFNYMDPIRPPEKEGDKPIVYLTVLNAFLEQIGKEPVTKVKGYKCL